MRNNIKRSILLLILIVCLMPLVMGAQAGNTSSCTNAQPSSDDIERIRQETLLKEAGSQIGMPAITNFREKKFLKEIFERRDQGIVTYTYAYSDMLACFRKIGDTQGYPIPYATQFSNPEKVEYISWSGGHSYVTLPQADPNALFSPSSAEATWTLMTNPNPATGVDGKKRVGPDSGAIYSEPKLFSSPFPLADAVLCDNVMERFADVLAKVLKK